MLNISQLLLRFISLILSVDSTQNFPPPLSAEEEREAFLKMKEGDGKARDKIIEHNLRLISHIIKKYYTSYPNPDELISVGSLGLIKAVDSFKADHGTRFATYGARCVQNEILMYFRSMKKNSSEIYINDVIDVDKDGNPLTYLDIIGTDEDITEEIDLKIHTERVLELVEEALDAREREIIVLRYGLRGYKPRTQREVAKYLGISRSYVSRIEKKALEKMRDSFGSSIPIFSD